MNCHLCQEKIINSETSKNIIESKNFAVKHGEYYICMACHDVQNLFDDIKPSNKPKERVESKPKEKKAPVVSKYMCRKCENTYEGSICTKCQTPNPLFARTKKKKKKKR